MLTRMTRVAILAEAMFYFSTVTESKVFQLRSDVGLEETSAESRSVQKRRVPG